MKKTLSLVAILGATTAMAQDLPQQSSTWFTDAQSMLETHLARTPNTNTAKNVIVLVADGNGVGTNYATRLFMGQQNGALGEEWVLPYETPEFYSALVKTYNINAQTPDSAPTAGALNTGVKQRFNLINLGEDAIHDDCSTVEGNELTLFSEMVSEAGKSVGIVSTARLTHATPAAVYSKTANRNWEDAVPEGCTAQVDIAQQLLNAMEAGTIDFAMGGGGRYFLPDGVEMGGLAGRRADGLNLVEKATGLGAQFATDQASFDALDLAAEGPVFGLFENSHMMYEADRSDEPSLAEMTRAAIEYLSQNENGYYLEIEAGRVDHANHAGNVYRTLTDGVAFAEAVALADELTDDADTLIIVTADHEHAIAFNGYCGRGSSITGLCRQIDEAGTEALAEPALGDDGKPYTVAGYLNGPGSVMQEQADGTWSGSRPEVSADEAEGRDYMQQALLPTSSETHSGEDVALFARGPWAHLFGGVMEQNEIFSVMNYAIKGQ